MGIFGKKLGKPDETKTLEQRMAELLDEVQALPQEKQESFWKKFEETQDDSKGKSETEEQINEAEEDIAEKGADSQTEKDRIDESVGEQEKQEGDEDSQDAKDRVDESIGEKEYVEKKDYEELLRRVEALETAKGDNELPKPKEVEDDEIDFGQTDFFKDKD